MRGEAQIGTVKVEFATSDTAVVALVGEHDLHSREALSATLASAAEGRNVLVDLSRCSFVDSAIISLLLITQRTLEQRDGRCELVIPPDAGYVRRLFEITGIAGLFRVHPSRNAGFAGMAASAAFPAAHAA
jgi:anti-anti-sigma factor